MRIFVLVGKPLEVEKTEKPTDEQIDKIHEQFIEMLKELFENEKGKYLADPTTELIIT